MVESGSLGHQGTEMPLVYETHVHSVAEDAPKDKITF